VVARSFGQGHADSDTRQGIAVANAFELSHSRENRPAQVNGTLTASYVYDGDGNRVRSVITAGSQVTETHYVGAHYERTLNSGNTKYYTIAGQLVAFERSSGYGVDWGRRFLFRDHLGSTNVIINGSSGLLLWRDRYLPFGDVRDTYRKDAGFSLQTQYRFTGQRLEQRLGAPEGGLDRGLYFYGARWYDSSLGRFIQADTIVPSPGNPQSLNRYAYVLNNPLRYTDPTGMFSEDEIMTYLGVDSWEAVLALFGQGGSLEGRWGWIEILRNARLGDSIAIRKHHSTWPNPSNGDVPTIFDGVFEEQDGQLVVRGRYGSQAAGRAGTAAILSATDAAVLVPASNASGVHEYWSTRLITASSVKWSRPKFHPDKVDWVGAGMDALGIGADLVTTGIGGRIVNGIQVGTVTGKIGKALDYTTAGRAAVSASSAALQGNFGWGDVGNLGLAGAGIWIPVVPDAASLITNLGGAISWLP